MHANIVGLIVLDNGLTCNLAEFSSADEVAAPYQLAELPETSRTNGKERLPQRYETTFLRADVQSLNQELEAQFNELLVRLFETS